MSSIDNVSESQLDITWGSFFISVPLTSALWGIGCLQLYQYYEKYWKTDHRWFGLYIFLIWTMDTAHQALVIYSNYVYFVKGILDRELLTTLPKTLRLTSAFTGPINALIQAILVRRVWYLSNGNRVLISFLSAAVVTQFIVTMAGYAKISNDATFAQVHESLPLEVAFACVSMFADALLAFTLAWLLWKARSGLPSSDSIVNRLMTYIVGSSILTVLCMVVSVVSAFAAPQPFMDWTANMIVPKLYFNCMLASLNARSHLRKNLVVSLDDINFRLTDPSRSECPVVTSRRMSSNIHNVVSNTDLETGQSTH